MRALFFFLFFKLFLLAYPLEQLSPGGIAKLYFNERPDIYINNKKQEVFALKRENDWMVLLPLSLYKGPEMLRVVSQTSKMIQVHLISLKPEQYEKQYLHVKNKEFVIASAKTLERVERESALKKEKFSRHTRLYIQDLRMIKPLDSKLRHDYGRRRFFNGVAKNPHAGIDLSGKKGDKIKAPLSGTVVVLGDLFYNGKMMLIDHGQGLITAYSHLSKIYLEDESWVRQGEYIGEVGQSGRVTGPHLHWSVYLNGEPVNPDLFLANEESLEDASL
jgi:murein DD-endopeptidase MepM/ murein hydrolase activator NlpD